MTDILAALKQIDVERQAMALVSSFDQNVQDIDTNFTDVRTAINALCVRVVALESQAAGQAVLSNFHITAPMRVDEGTDLTGQMYDATYDIFASALVANARLVGESIVPAAAPTVLVADASRVEGANTQAFTFPAGVDFSTAGNNFEVRLELYGEGQVPGTDTPVQQLEQRIIAQAPPRTDLFYWGASTDNTPANVDVLTLESQTALTGNVTLPNFTENSYIIFASPATAPRITGIAFGGFQQIAAFPLVVDAMGDPVTIDVSGVAYVLNISTNLLLPSAFGGQVATITR